MDSILIVDDDRMALESLSRALSACDLKVNFYTATKADEALAIFEKESPLCAVLDLCLNEKQGVESGFMLLAEMLNKDSTCRIIVLTGHGSFEYGIRSLQQGAASFLEKPADPDHLSALIQDGLKQARLRRAFKELKKDRSDIELAELIVGSSDSMKSLRESIVYAARTRQAVLIYGETGSGKGLCARAIHRFGDRAQFRFIRYQPGFTNPDIVNSELFGHIKGAFTGAEQSRRGLILEAHRGTLFLDEIDEFPPETQVILLDVLQERRFRPIGSNDEAGADFRLICASNADLSACIDSGKIRKDFYHRIAHQMIEIPPLREHRVDIPEFCESIILRLQDKEGLQILGVEDLALDALAQHDWPGNVRELEAVLEGAACKALFRGKNYISKEDLSFTASHSQQNPVGFHEEVESFKLELIKSALLKNEGNQAQTARELGIDRSSLRRILARNFHQSER